MTVDRTPKASAAGQSADDRVINESGIEIKKLYTREDVEASGGIDCGGVEIARNFAEADRIRDQLDAMGVALKDTREADSGELVTSWEPKR